MAEFSANAVQTVQPGQAVVFTSSPNPCNRGLIRWREDSGQFNLSGWIPCDILKRRCCCKGTPSANYLASFSANIAVPTGETVGPISLAYQIGGVTIPASTMTSTPAAVEEFNNVSATIDVPVWYNCCETFTVVNTSTIPIEVRNANLVVRRPDLYLTN